MALAVLLIPQLAVTAKAEDPAFSSATTFTPGTTLSGTLVKEGYDITNQCYSFTMDKGGVFSYTVKSDDFTGVDVKVYTYTTYEEVYDNNGYILSGSASLAKGKYYLVIGEDEEKAGSFTVENSVEYAENSVNYNDYAYAGDLTIGTDIKGNIGKVARNEYEGSFYKFTMSYGGVISFNIESATVTEADVKIYNAQKQKVYDNSAGIVSGNASLAKGTYYLVVREYDGGGNYTLHTSVTYAKNSANYTTTTSAKSFTIGTALYGNIGKSTQYDYEKSYYKFTMTYGGILKFKITAKPVTAYGLTSDSVDEADVKIYNANNKEVYDNDGGIISGTASLAKGTYYLVVDEYGDEGNYVLRTSVKYAKDSANYNSFTKAKTKSIGSAIYGNIGKVGNYDYEDSYYKVKMAYAGTFKFKVTTDMESVRLRIYDSSKKELDYNTDNSGSISLAKGTYYIQVSQYSGTGNYTLKTYARYKNPISVKASKTSVKYSKTKNQTIKLTVSNAQGKVTYKSSYSKVTVSSKGVVTVKKGAKKCTVTITVKAAGTSSSNAVYYAAGTKTIKIKIK